VADCGGGMSASCKPRVQLFADAGNGWPHSALRYIISSCQSAATSETVKRFWSRTHVRSVITSIATFTFDYYRTTGRPTGPHHWRQDAALYSMSRTALVLRCPWALSAFLSLSLTSPVIHRHSPALSVSAV